MKRFALPLMLIGGALLALPALADESPGPDGPKGPQCSYIGSWFGYNENGLSWTSQANGANESRGNAMLEFPGFPLDVFGLFPDAVDRARNSKGSWVRTGARSFETTGLGFAWDVNRVTQYIVKVANRVVFEDDCDVMHVESTWVSIFYPHDDPYEDEPVVGPLTFPGHYGYRVRVDLPEELD